MWHRANRQTLASLSPLLPNRIDVTDGKTVWRFQPHSTDCLTHNKIPLAVAAACVCSGKARKPGKGWWGSELTRTTRSSRFTVSQQHDFPLAERQINIVVRVQSSCCWILDNKGYVHFRFISSGMWPHWREDSLIFLSGHRLGALMKQGFLSNVTKYNW